MANPRQRRKARSGGGSAKPGTNALRRLHNREHRVGEVRGPQALREGWDKKKTVKQNYEALGLLSGIPVNVKASSSSAAAVAEQEAANAEAGPKVTGYGQIIRDAEGNIIDVIIPEDDDDGANVGGEADGDEEEAPVVKKVEAKTKVAKELEQLSATVKPVIRHSSTSEHQWLLNLVQKYGDDTDKMFKDRKMNIWQKTEGEIKRMLRKAGGVNSLRKELQSQSNAQMED